MNGENEGHPPRGRGRPKLTPDHELREQLARAAWKLFVEKGYGGTTMQDVGTACGMSKRTVYRLFASKSELFAEVVSLHRQSMVALPGDYDALPLEEALARIFLIDIDPQAETARSALMAVIMTEGAQFPELRAMVRDFGAGPSFRLLSEWLADQKRKGRIQVADEGIAARMLMDIVFGAVALKSGEGPQWPGATTRAGYLRQCFRIAVSGLANGAAV